MIRLWKWYSRNLHMQFFSYFLSDWFNIWYTFNFDQSAGRSHRLRQLSTLVNNLLLLFISYSLTLRILHCAKMPFTKVAFWTHKFLVNKNVYLVVVFCAWSFLDSNQCRVARKLALYHRSFWCKRDGCVTSTACLSPLCAQVQYMPLSWGSTNRHGWKTTWTILNENFSKSAHNLPSLPFCLVTSSLSVL